jgi:hypothetical protein
VRIQIMAGLGTNAAGAVGMREPHCAKGIDLSNLNGTSSGTIVGYGPDFL